MYFGQVSDSDSDNTVWGRPEDMRGVRPSYAITRNKPGSDLAAESAAALAAASIVLKDTNPIYSEKLVNHSVSLLRFADRYRAKYDKSITDASLKYRYRSVLQLLRNTKHIAHLVRLFPNGIFLIFLAPVTILMK